MTEPLGLRQGTLRLVPSSDVWPQCFAQEQARITAAVAPLAPPIAHIGSTAVPGLVAKPILDIAVIAPAADHPRIAAALATLGYLDRGIRSGRLFIRLRDGDVRTHNLHLYTPRDAAWHDHLAFRDALRADPDLRTAYAALKHEIARNLQGKRLGYAEAKTDFIRNALRRQAPKEADMKRKTLVPATMQAASDLGTSPGIISGNHVFLTGMTGSNPDGTMPENPADQFRQAFEKIAAVLREAGLDCAAIVEMTSYHIHLRDHFDLFSHIRAGYVRDPFPAWTAVEVAGLRRAGALVEIRVIAAIGD